MLTVGGVLTTSNQQLSSGMLSIDALAARACRLCGMCQTFFVVTLSQIVKICISKHMVISNLRSAGSNPQKN